MDEHGEIEVLLETYLRKVDELENEVRTNVKSISLTEEHIQIRLDTVRNAMMKVDLLVTICTFAVATAALIASTFGMNLRSHLEQSPFAFYVTSAVMVVLAVALVKLGLRLCRTHKIDLFHVEPDEPKLRLPINSLKKHKRRTSPVHRVKAGDKGEKGEKGKKGEGEDEAVPYDRSDWYDRSRTLEWKLEQLEAMKMKQETTGPVLARGPLRRPLQAARRQEGMARLQRPMRGTANAPNSLLQPSSSLLLFVASMYSCALCRAACVLTCPLLSLPPPVS